MVSEWCLGRVSGVSLGCLEVVWGVFGECVGAFGGVWGVLAGVLGAVLDTFSDLGTGQINLKMSKSIQKSLKLIQLSKIFLRGVKIRLLVYLNPLGTFCLGADTIFQSSPCKGQFYYKT